MREVKCWYAQLGLLYIALYIIPPGYVMRHANCVYKAWGHLCLSQQIRPERIFQSCELQWLANHLFAPHKLATTASIVKQGGPRSAINIFP